MGGKGLGRQTAGLDGETPVVIALDAVKALQGVIVPHPRIHKRLRLRPVLAADIIVNLVVVALRVERRINITEVNGLILDVLPQHFEVIAVVKGVFHFPYNFAVESRTPARAVCRASRYNENRSMNDE